jgi:hypothetical protein
LSFKGAPNKYQLVSVVLLMVVAVAAAYLVLVSPG